MGLPTQGIGLRPQPWALLSRPVGPAHDGGAIDNRRAVFYFSKVAESITLRELRNESGEIMRRLDQGESFIVTRNGVPVGELTPLRRHRFVSAAAVLAIFRNAPAVDPDRFRADLDAWADQDILPHA